jgi:hypothetical protein
MTDYTAPAVLIFMGLIPLVMVLLGKYLKLTNNVKVVLIVLGIGVITVGVAAGTGVLDFLGGEEAQVIEEQPSYEVSVDEDMAHVTYDSDTHIFTMAVSFNDTTDAFVGVTNYYQANFTISRADLLDSDAITTGILGVVGVVDVTGASDEYLIDQNADDTFKASWTKVSGLSTVSTWENVNIKVESGDSNWAILNITLNSVALANMEQYDSGVIDFVLAGIHYQIVVLKATVSA